MVNLRLNIGICALSFTLFFLVGVRPASADTNISAVMTDHWAWNDIIGWIDFYNTQTITVKDGKLTGYASSSVEDISLECTTTRNGNICPQSSYRVLNDGGGNLSGWGWNDQVGWISFDCHNNNGCATSNYQVYIDINGDFNNYAWNDVIGWISFNCGNSSGCGASNYKVNTSWAGNSTIATLDSSIFDTGVSGGAQLNSVSWHGSQPAGTAVRFQFAVSNASSGPWNYSGTDGTANTYYNTGPDLSLKLDYVLQNGKRYFRYRVFLRSNLNKTTSPRVDDVIVNWSP